MKDRLAIIRNIRLKARMVRETERHLTEELGPDVLQDVNTNELSMRLSTQHRR